MPAIADEPLYSADYQAAYPQEYAGLSTTLDPNNEDFLAYNPYGPRRYVQGPAFDPTLGPNEPYPGTVPQNEFTSYSPYDQVNAPQAPYEGAGYPEPQPEEGIGYPQPQPNPPLPEFAVNRPGFIYKGPVAGEGAARYAWNEAGPPEPEIPDRTGNAYARQYGLEFDRRRAQAEQQRQIEADYMNAKTTGQLAAVKAAAEHLREREMSEFLASGGSHAEGLLRFGISGGSPTATASALRAIERNAPPQVFDVGNGERVVRDGTHLIKLTPPKIGPNGQTVEPVAHPVFTLDGQRTDEFAYPKKDGGWEYHKGPPEAVVSFETQGAGPFDKGYKVRGTAGSVQTLTNPTNAFGISLPKGPPRTNDVVTGEVPAAPVETGNEVAQEPKQITSQKQFDDLPHGAVYIGKDGKPYRKP